MLNVKAQIILIAKNVEMDIILTGLHVLQHVQQVNLEITMGKELITTLFAKAVIKLVLSVLVNYIINVKAVMMDGFLM